MSGEDSGKRKIQSSSDSLVVKKHKSSSEIGVWCEEVAASETKEDSPSSPSTPHSSPRTPHAASTMPGAPPPPPPPSVPLQQPRAVPKVALRVHRPGAYQLPNDAEILKTYEAKINSHKMEAQISQTLQQFRHQWSIKYSGANQGGAAVKRTSEESH